MADTSRNENIDGSMMAFIPLSKISGSFVGKNIHIQNALSFTQRGVKNTKGVNSDSAFNIPFLQASEQGSSVGTTTDIGNGKLSFGVFDGKSREYGLETKGFISEYGRELGSSLGSIFFGVNNESDGFLETSIEGAFAEDSKSSTTFFGMSSYGWLNNKWSYNMLGSIGSTQMNVEGVGLLSDINNVKSTSFAFEASRPIGFVEKDRFYIGISQPLRVESGKASVMVPQLYEIGGNMNFDKANVDLAPSGRQLNLGLGYQATLYNFINVGVRTALSQDYGHKKSDNIVNSMVGFVKFGF
jgi:hypothetical protein